MPRAAVPGTLQGSIVRVRGVCGVIPNARRQLTGIELWIPLPQMIQVEQAAPADLFALPHRSIGSLRRFSAFNAVNQKVRTTGTVVLHEPGRYLYVQDHGDSVFVLSHQPEPLRPGDRIEVVGLPGNDGRKFLLREAVYRRLSSGVEPAPARIQASNSVAEEMAGLLVEAEGKLLNVARRQEGADLLVEAQNAVFAAKLYGAVGAKELDTLQTGSRLRLTGVYELQMDEYGKPKGFVLRLRSWNDLAVLQSAPWWTPARLWWMVAVVVAVFLVALLYAVLMSGKNRLLNEAQIKLQRANDELEDRVADRTRELRDEVAAKERAHAELAQAQQRLIAASRQAGMADVATAILHNVGNVLNSVNVSASLIRDQLRRSPIRTLAKAATMLEERMSDLAVFLQDDPKGKLLPAYLKNLGETLIQERQAVQAEVESLTKNVEHIKVIVAMQQSHARMAGIIEQADANELMESAIRINFATYEQHQIRLTRDFQPVPRLLVDTHKVLQILVNLLNNAAHALERTPSDRRQVIVSIFANDSGQVCLRVGDNGVGIEPDNLNRIFSQGFTTRKDGHGFGLHSGANAAKEMRGSLSVHSAGIGQGATFTLALPVAQEAKPGSASPDCVVVCG